MNRIGVPMGELLFSFSQMARALAALGNDQSIG